MIGTYSAQDRFVIYTHPTYGEHTVIQFHGKSKATTTTRLSKKAAKVLNTLGWEFATHPLANTPEARTSRRAGYVLYFTVEKYVSEGLQVLGDALDISQYSISIDL